MEMREVKAKTEIEDWVSSVVRKKTISVLKRERELVKRVWSCLALWKPFS